MFSSSLLYLIGTPNVLFNCTGWQQLACATSARAAEYSAPALDPSDQACFTKNATPWGPARAGLLRPPGTSSLSKSYILRGESRRTRPQIEREASGKRP